MEDKIIYTVKEVSEIIHTNPTYVYTLIKSGLLPALKLGSMFLLILIQTEKALSGADVPKKA